MVERLRESRFLLHALKAGRQRMQQETADELLGGDRRYLVLVPGAGSLSSETKLFGRLAALPDAGWRWPRDECSGRDTRSPGAVRRRVAWRKPPIRFGGQAPEIERTQRGPARAPG